MILEEEKTLGIINKSTCIKRRIWLKVEEPKYITVFQNQGEQKKMMPYIPLKPQRLIASWPYLRI
jgi:hypothetical protein